MDDITSRHISYYRTRHQMVKEEKERLLTALRAQEIQEQQLSRQFAQKFPDESLFGPAVPFDELTPHEQHVLHFVARRGRVRRVAQLVGPFAASSGAAMTEAAFRTHLSRLREKGALVRGGDGWMVAEVHLSRALEPLTPLAPPQKTGMGAVAARATKLAFSPREPSRLPPALAVLIGAFPKTRSVRVAELVTAHGMQGKGGEAVVRRNLARATKLGLIRKVGPNEYALKEVETEPASPFPDKLRGILATLPAQRAITLDEWTRLALGGVDQEARDVMSARASALVRMGLVERVGRALYRQKSKAEAELSEPSAPKAGNKKLAGALDATLPSDLAAVLALVPVRGDVTLEALAVLADGTNAERSGRLAGQVYRLVQRGRLERVAAQTYRRPLPTPSAIVERALTHVPADGIATVAQLVVRVEGRMSASGIARVREEVDALVAKGKVRQVDGGYQRVPPGEGEEHSPAPEAVVVDAVEASVPRVDIAASVQVRRETVRGTEVAAETPRHEPGGGAPSPLTPTSSLEGSRDLARVVWALDYAKAHGLGPLTPAAMARLCTEKAGVPVQGPNMGRFFRENKTKGRFLARWVEEEGRYRGV